MNNLFKLISTFSDEEQKEAVQFLKKKNRRGDAKNILLFKMICQGKTKFCDRGKTFKKTLGGYV